MKFNKVAILSALSLGSGVAARSSRLRVQGDEKGPIAERSRVTAFVVTDEGVKMQCWEVGDYLPDASGAKGGVRAVEFSNTAQVTLFSFPPSTTLFSSGQAGLKTSDVDFTKGGNLFTVKDGLILINVPGANSGDVRATEAAQNYVFADINGDDWFYFEDRTTSDDDSVEGCEKSQSKNRAGGSEITGTAVSGSETTLINFKYKETPGHKVLHDGACNFAGLATGDNSNQD